MKSRSLVSRAFFASVLLPLVFGVPRGSAEVTFDVFRPDAVTQSYFTSTITFNPNSGPINLIPGEATTVSFDNMDWLLQSTSSTGSAYFSADRSVQVGGRVGTLSQQFLWEVRLSFDSITLQQGQTLSLDLGPVGILDVTPTASIFTWSEHGEGHYYFPAYATFLLHDVIDLSKFSGGLGDVPGGAFVSIAYGVSNGGSIVTGQATSGVNGTRFRWRLDSGMIDMGGNPDGINAESHHISADGSSFTGFVGNNHQYTAFLDSSNFGFHLIPFLPGDTAASGQGVSADGAYVAGYSYGSDPAHVAHAFRYQNGVTSDLGSLRAGNATTRAWDISGDGLVVVGYSQSDRTVGSNTEAFRWVSGTMAGLGDLTGSATYVNSAAYGVSQDGNVVVGQSDSPPGPQAFRWTQSGGMIALGDLPEGSFNSAAIGTSADGSVVVGFGSDNDGQVAIVWDKVHGLRKLQTVLLNEYGVNFEGWLLTYATAISPDAKAVVGKGTDPLGNQEAFLAQINSRTRRFLANQTFTGFHTSHLGGLGTAVDFLGGATTAPRAVTLDTTTNSTTSPTASDITTVTGTSSETFVLQLSYDPATAASSLGSDQSLLLGWSNGTAWVNALDGNSGGSPMFVGPYDGNATLGNCGLDTTNHVVWAVVNHGGQFAVLSHIAPISTFANWKQAHFTPAQLSDPTISGDAADPDGDGLSNLLEYAFNTDPNTASTANRPSLSRDATYLSLTYTKLLGATDLTYTIEESLDLVRWVAKSPVNQVLSDNGVLQVIKAQVPNSDAAPRGRLFLRLRVSH